LWQCCSSFHGVAMLRRRALPQTKYYAPLTPKSHPLWVYNHRG
jgi:hypothetical protein